MQSSLFLVTGVPPKKANCVGHDADSRLLCAVGSKKHSKLPDFRPHASIVVLPKRIDTQLQALLEGSCGSVTACNDGPQRIVFMYYIASDLFMHYITFGYVLGTN